MLRLCFSSVAFCIVFCIAASAPLWLDDGYRLSNWPESRYYTGYFVVEHEGNVNEARDRAVSGARSELAKSIQNNITSVTTSVVETVESGNGYSERERFGLQSVESTSVSLINISTEVYVYEDKPLVAAFAKIDRVGPSGYYQSCIERDLHLAQLAIEESVSLFERGEKKLSHERCRTVTDILNNTSGYIDIVNTIGESRDSCGVYMDRLARLKSSAEKFLAETDRSIRVFLNIDERIGSRHVSIIEGRLKESLSGNGCEIVPIDDNADYVLTLNATTRPSSDDGGIVFVFADLDVELKHLHTGKSLYMSEFSKKGGGVSFDKAARKAFDNAAKELITKLKENIK